MDLMKRMLVMFVALMVCLTASCDVFRAREVRAGLDSSIEQLPHLRDFELITVLKGSSAIERCHYAEAEVVLGTSLEEEKAIDEYVNRLKAVGWLETELQNELKRGLTRGAQERIVVRAGHPNSDVERDADYIQAKDAFPTIIFVRLVFYVPQRDGC
jgi:hypothetical protein